MNPCQTPYCKSKAYTGKNYCCKCRQRRYRKNNPLAAAFHNLKGHAKERNKEFLFTLSTFDKFCLETGYLSKRLAGIDVTIDRIIETGPYSYSNCQVLMNVDNVNKYRHEQLSIEEMETKLGKEIFYSGNPI